MLNLDAGGVPGEASAMRVVTTASELQDLMAEISEPDGVVVPTMGSLHVGHLALVRQGVEAARGSRRGCIVTVFVNPRQFNEQVDFDRYPRMLDADLERIEAQGAGVVFAPPVELVYPDSPEADFSDVALPEVARTDRGLEDTYRPGHFPGVRDVLLRLYDLLRPEAAIYGEKDWQQLQLAKALPARAWGKVRVIPGPTYREDDGLAMSSRNLLLSPEARVQARALSRSLLAACAHAEPGAAEAAMRETMSEAGLEAEYAAVRDAQTLLEPEAGASRPCRCLVAARVGGVRLLDNTSWPEPEASLKSLMG